MGGGETDVGLLNSGVAAHRPDPEATLPDRQPDHLTGQVVDQLGTEAAGQLADRGLVGHQDSGQTRTGRPGDRTQAAGRHDGADSGQHRAVGTRRAVCTPSGSGGSSRGIDSVATTSRPRSRAASAAATSVGASSSVPADRGRPARPARARPASSAVAPGGRPRATARRGAPRQVSARRARGAPAGRARASRATTGSTRSPTTGATALGPRPARSGACATRR